MLAEVERAIARELGAMIERGPTRDEMERCMAQAESHFIFRLADRRRLRRKSDQLNAYNIFLGDPGYFGTDLERYRGATAKRFAALPRAGSCLASASS